MPWYREIAGVIPKHVFLKGIGTMLFISVFFGAYFYLLKRPAYPTTVMPFTLLDSLISFQPSAMPLYISLWVYVSLPPVLLATRCELYAYAIAMAGTCLAGLIIFYFWPTTVPAADIDWTLYPGVDFLKNMDASGNACPSLHVTTALFSGAWLHHLLRRFNGPQWIRLLNWMWCIGIIYSTLATRQHVAIDVGGGLALGGLASCLSLRYRVTLQGSGKVSGRAPSAFIKRLVSMASAPYKPLGLYAWFFARGKLGGDPVFVHLLATGLLSGHSRILDIGCGQGLLTSWLLAAQTLAARGQWPAAWPHAPQTVHVKGLELMAHDVARADQAMKKAVSAGHVKFVRTDMRNANFSQTDAVVILDVLHYVPVTAQDDVLHRVRRSLASGGVLLLRVGDANGGLPFLISTLVDHVVNALRGHRLEKLHYRTLAEWQAALQKLGFMVETQAMSQGTPFANVLLIARLPSVR